MKLNSRSEQKKASRFLTSVLSAFLLLSILQVAYSQTTSKNASTDNPYSFGATRTNGGNGGKIIRVTNLNGKGTGSLTAAIAEEGPRIIVFEVAGTIDLGGEALAVKNPFVTIAGQTAPSPGVTLTNGGLRVDSHDVIIQHIRVRTGSVIQNELDAFTTSGAHDVIIDHCTFTWAVDENCSVSGPRFEGNTPDDWRKNTSHRITISNNIIAEALSNSIHSKGEHSKGTLVHDNASDILIYGNLYSCNVDRNALFKGGARAVFVNNYIYNPGVKALHYAMVKTQWKDKELQAGKLTIVGNVLQYGPDTQDIPFIDVWNVGPSEIFLDDNIARNTQGKSTVMFQGDSSSLVGTAPLWFPGLKAVPASELESIVLREAGARPWDRDSHDLRIIENVKNRQGKIIDSEKQLGGLPVVKATHAPFKLNDWNLDTMTKRKSPKISDR